MRDKRVEFLRFFNDYRMIAIFTLDVVALSIVTFVGCYSVAMVGGLKVLGVMFVSFAVTVIVLYIYVKTKRSASKAFLKHWLFNRGIYRLQEDEEKWEELKNTDSLGYFPSGQDKFFAD